MRRYSDYSKNGKKVDDSKVKWVQYVIVVPTEDDKNELMECSEHIHDCDIDTDILGVNSLAHEYLEGYSIVVSKKLYEALNNYNKKSKSKK